MKGNFSVACYVNQREGKVSLWKLKKGMLAESRDHYCNVHKVQADPLARLYAFIIDTYAKRMFIVCEKTIKVCTDKGAKEIGALREGDAIIIKGEFVKSKYSAIKSIKVCRYTDDTDGCVPMFNADEVFINDILCKF